MSYTQLHATCVSIDSKGILLLGPPGSGKSDLALRLIDGGAMLVADDRVDICLFPHSLSPSLKGRGKLIASAPQNLRGMLEARGIGIMRMPYNEQVTLALAVELVARDKVERLPEPQFRDCLGVQLPLLSLHAFDSSADVKIRVYVRNI